MTETAIDQRYLDAAKSRYTSLRTHIFVELSEHCTVDHKGRAADAVADLVRPELESSYAVLLESNDRRDAAIAQAASLRAEIDSLRAQIAKQIETTPHPCQEPDGTYCPCADLQRKQDAAIARGDAAVAESRPV